MNIACDANVGVLLATYNGARYVAQQIKSLQENRTPFVLHWLDDHSTDDTREIVRAAALSSRIELREWHQGHRLGVPAAFFRLLECVEADIYLFCDQDDIWQAGKIDAAVTDLLPDVGSPAMCFSDPFMLYGDGTEAARRLSEVVGGKAVLAADSSTLFMPLGAPGHTQAFTRPLRDLFMQHRDVARSHALMHDMWMRIIAVAAGSARLLPNAPTTLYRQHADNVSGFFFRSTTWGAKWKLHQFMRLAIARQAQGFALVARTLPASPRLERMLSKARIAATLDKRQSPAGLLRLIRHGVMWTDWRLALWLVATCLSADAAPTSLMPTSVDIREKA